MASNLEESFKQAIHDLNGLPKDVDLPEKTKLRLYGLYCSVMKGPKLPSIASEELIRNKTEALKRKAWKDASKLSRVQAMEEYCEIVKELKHETRRPVTMSGNMFRKDAQLGWTRTYVELKERVLYYYDFKKNDMSPQAKSEAEPRDQANTYPSGVLFLMDGCVVSSVDDPVLRSSATGMEPKSPSSKGTLSELFVFTIAHAKAHKVFTLGTQSRDDARRWMDAIRLESTRKSGTNGSVSSLQAITMDSSNADMYKDSFELRHFLPPVRSSQDYAVPAAFSFTLDDSVANFLNLSSDASLWSFSHEHLNVRTFIQKGDNLPGVSVEDSKSVVGVFGHALEISAPARCVFDLVWNMGARRNIDPQLESWSIVEELGPQTRVDHIVYSAVWPTSRRDFCRLSHYRVDERDGSILVVGMSVSHLMCPSLRDAVRAKLFCTGFLIVPTSERTCQVKYLIVVDPVISSIPRRFVMSVATSQTSILEKMQSYFSEHEFLINGALLKGPVRNIALATPELVHRKKKRSTASIVSSMISGGGAQFVKNSAYGEVSMPPLKETVIKVIFDEQLERWWLKVWFIAVICVVVTNSLDANTLNLLALVLASWGVVLNPSRRAFVTAQLQIPATMDKTYLAVMIQKSLDECPSMNGSFSFFGRWQPAKRSCVAVLNDIRSGNAVVYTELPQKMEGEGFTNEDNVGSYTALFVTQAVVTDHPRWTLAPILFSCFGDRLLVSVDRRCMQDFNKFITLTESFLVDENRSAPLDMKQMAASPVAGFSSPGFFPRSEHGGGSERSMLLKQDPAGSRRLSNGPLLFRADSSRSVI